MDSKLVNNRIANSSRYPLAGPLKIRDGLPTYNLGSDVDLPDPSDTFKCLKWIGLLDKKIVKLEQSLISFI